MPLSHLKQVEPRLTRLRSYVLLYGLLSLYVLFVTLASVPMTYKDMLLSAVDLFACLWVQPRWAMSQGLSIQGNTKEEACGTICHSAIFISLLIICFHTCEPGFDPGWLVCVNALNQFWPSFRCPCAWKWYKTLWLFMASFWYARRLISFLYTSAL